MDALTRFGHCNILLRMSNSAFCLRGRVRYRSKTHYEVLGVGKTCSTKDLRKAYMALSKKLHPDVSPGNHAEFVLLNEAYQTLSRSHSRAIYDASLFRSPPGGGSWKRHGDFETTAPDDQVFWDQSIWSMRDRSADASSRSKPYYGIKGVRRLANGRVAVFIVLFMALGVAFHVFTISSSHQVATSYAEEKSRRLSAVYIEAKYKAIDPKDKGKIESFLKSVRPDSVD